MRYAFIRETLADRELYGMPLSERCRILGVSTSGYYEWLRRRNGRPRKKLHVPKRVMLSDETVLTSVRRLRGLLGYTPGYRQFHELLRKRGIRVGVTRLQRLLRTNGFIGYRHSKRPYKTTDSNHDMTVYPNLLNRDFSPGKLNRAWVSDITYLPTPNGTSYLAAFMDLGSRRILGWAIDTKMTTELILKTLDMAVQTRRQERLSVVGTIVHSDRGSQYCSQKFQGRLAQLNMRPSMSRSGNCWDNAPGESIWSSLKREVLIGWKRFAGHEAAVTAVAHWIHVYNHVCPHSSIAMKTPLEYEEDLATSKSVKPSA